MERVSEPFEFDVRSPLPALEFDVGPPRPRDDDDGREPDEPEPEHDG